MPWIFRQRSPFKGQVFADDPDVENRMSLDEIVTLSHASHGLKSKQDYRPDLSRVPRHLVLDRPVKKLMDFFFVANKLHIMSERFLDLVQRLDDGLHLSWPVTIRTKKEVHAEGKFHAVLIKGFGAALTEEGSHLVVSKPFLQKLSDRTVHRPRQVFLSMEDEACVRKDQLPPHHLWWDHGLTASPACYLLGSDRLQDEIARGGFDVFKVKRLRLRECAESEAPC